MSASIPDILAGLKDALSGLDIEVTDYIPDSPLLPGIAVKVESWPFDPTADATFVFYCWAGTGDMQDAQATVMEWLSDDGDQSICAALDADSTLGGLVGSVLPLEVRSWTVVEAPNQTRILQAELVLQVLR